MNFSVVGIYLGAGKSLRMGRNKLELPLEETYLGSKGFQAALESKLDWIIAVTRSGDPLHWLAPFSKRTGWSMLQCSNADCGLSSSLKAGVQAALAIRAKTIVILLADQPMVSSRIIDLLLKQHRKPFTAASKNGVPMPPIVFSQSFFPSLLELKGDKGAREVIRSAWKQGRSLELDGAILADIDTEEDYRNLIENKGEWS